MRLLVDTHIPLRVLSDDPRLNPKDRSVLLYAQETIVSAASIWEISIKRALGKLKASENLLEHVKAAGYLPLSVTWVHAETAGALSPHHADPFDRLLIAQTQYEGLTILTKDS
ncbi:MAG: type II toxin-antitoxin system VapC family toxin [Gammaproteobacteria bacterium]|nr:type II toxin-antitoxin system VapC family toxin [Gammaproteobacteria bacterium]